MQKCTDQLLDSINHVRQLLKCNFCIAHSKHENHRILELEGDLEIYQENIFHLLWESANVEKIIQLSDAIIISEDANN